MNIKDITFLDFETTGLDINTCEIASAYISNKRLKYTIDCLVKTGGKMPEKATEIHGITNEMLEDAPDKIGVLKSVSNLFNQCDYVSGYNILKYDVPLLINECERLDIQLDYMNVKYLDVFYVVKNILTKEDKKLITSLSLENVYKYFIGKKFNAHEARADVKATEKLLKYFIDGGYDVEKYILPFENLRGQQISHDNVKISLGKYQNREIGDIMTEDPSYLQWCVDRGIIKLTNKMTEKLETACKK